MPSQNSPLVSLAPARNIWSESLDPIDRGKLATHALARALHQETLIAFVGAGCSAGLKNAYEKNYPTWVQLVGSLIDSDHISNRLEDKELLHALKSGKFPHLPGLNQVAMGIFRDGAEASGFREFVRNTFSPATDPPEKIDNPYRALLGCDITRFITTNYDVELERAICAFGTKHRRDYRKEELGLDERSGDFETSPLSFTQASQVARLAQFGLAKTPGTEGMVFHCHGRFDAPDSLVASERDYQKWYLDSSDLKAGAFLQTLNFTLTSNPVLFVGYGLAEGDLLRPLRMLHARRPSVSDRRQLFALLPYADTKAGRAQLKVQSEFYLAKYGILVIPYRASRASAANLSAELKRLHDEVVSLREDWLAKPSIRRVTPVVDNDEKVLTYFHYHIDTKPGESFYRKTTIDPWFEAVAHGTSIPTDARQESASGESKCVYLLLGGGGNGKSYRALELLRRARKGKRVGNALPFEGVFFWSSYYVDDCLTGMERAVQFVEHAKQRKRTGDSPYQCLEDGLNNGRYLLVFDGIERLLRGGDLPGRGQPYRDGVRRFLELITRIKPDKSIVILTSRLMPSTFVDDNSGAERSRVQTVDIGGLTYQQLADRQPFKTLDPQRRAELCSLLGGHAYGLTLAAAHIGNTIQQPSSKTRQMERAAELCAKLAHTPPERRVSRMIREAIAAVEVRIQSKGIPRGSARALLERAALFMSPIDHDGLLCCYEQWLRSTPTAEAAESLKSMPDPKRWLRIAVDGLLDARLLFRVAQVPAATGDGESGCLTVHPLVREFVYRILHEAPGEPLPNFTLTGVTSATSRVFPGLAADAPATVTGVINALLRGAAGENEPLKVRRMLRHAFGVARSRMEANTTTRWTTHRKYFSQMLTIADAVRKASLPHTWRYAERSDTDIFLREEGILYADELAWLYNDLGLSLCLEGSVRDAYDMWEQGYAINRVVDQGEDGGQYIVQSLLHLSYIFIEIGHLDIAESFLLQTVHENHRLKDEDYKRRIMGYRGLVAHLQGDWQRAERFYIDAVQREDGRTSNDRADAIFLRHRADLNISLNKLDEADQLLRLSRAHAQYGGHRDLTAYAKNTEGHIARRRGRAQEANTSYGIALTQSRELGIRKLEAEVLAEQSRLALETGDTDSARERALESLSIANELGLGLHQTQSLVVLGLSMLYTGKVDLGKAYLEHAGKLANLQQYWSRHQEIEGALVSAGGRIAF